MAHGLTFERFVHHPPQRVWKALTESKWLEAWYFPNDFQPIVGHQFQFRSDPAPGFDGILTCKVVEIEEPARLVYTFKGGWLNRETTVTWTLTAREDGTLLRLEHTGFTGLHALTTRGILGFGWWRFLRGLPAVLDRLAFDSVA